MFFSGYHLLQFGFVFFKIKNLLKRFDYIQFWERRYWIGETLSFMPIWILRCSLGSSFIGFLIWLSLNLFCLDFSLFTKIILSSGLFYVVLIWKLKNEGFGLT